MAAGRRCSKTRASFSGWSRMACRSCPSMALSSSLRPGLVRPAGTREEGEAGRNGRDRSTWKTGEDERAETADEAELAGDEADAGVDEGADQEDQGGLG